MVQQQVKRVSKEELLKIIETRKPKGLFMGRDDEWYVGIDNTDGYAWTEGFATTEECEKWLKEGIKDG